MRITDYTVHLSVRELVEYVLREGSISASFVSPARAVEGTRAHKKVQDEAEGNYEREVRLIEESYVDTLTFIVEGRADGIITDLVGVTIDEIKSTRVSLDQIDENFNPLHWAQAKCYGYFYAKQNKLKDIAIRLTYYHLETKKIKYLVKVYSIEALRVFYEDLLERYAVWIKFYMAWIEERTGYLKQLQFPFEQYRQGQRELAVDVYQSIKRSQNLYINAPTGVGKTLSTLFPALKAMGEGEVGKIFYLTAKTITRTVAEKSLQMMRSDKVRMKSITLTAKDKICFCAERRCHPDFCQYAKGHYDRVDEAVYEAICETDHFTREVIEGYAKKFRVCPFEMSLDLAIYADVVICDYNYVFDPSVSLKRFLDQKNFVILVDEAHNLVERAREMYSESLSEQEVKSVKQTIQKTYPTVAKTLVTIEEHFMKKRSQIIDEMGYMMDEEAPDELASLCRRFIKECDQKLQKGAMHKLPQDLMNLYFKAFNFGRVYDLFDSHYVTYGEEQVDGFFIKMFCIDPSFNVSEAISTCKMTCFFSATFLPIQYFKYMLGGEKDRAIAIQSPFDSQASLKLITTDVSTRYKDRVRSYPQIASYIKQMVGDKIGNYMVFFPSYTYMQEVHDALKVHVEESSDWHIQMQTTQMNEAQREVFLEKFEAHPTQITIGFCVLGGIFSEGIDLVGERLIGVAVVGVGLPQIGLERQLIQQHFEHQDKEGYHYAYTYPGMNKVLQAVGRLIRTETDYGINLLIDDRYNTATYRQLMPEHMQPIQKVTLHNVSQTIKNFWDTDKNVRTDKNNPNCQGS